MNKVLQFISVFSLSLSSVLFAQEDQPDLYDIAGEFAFVRIQYNSYYGSGYYGGPWLTDFPAADENFLRGVARLTNVRVMTSPEVLRFDDEEIFDYPFLYALEMGRNGGLSLSPAEIENLREYLLRGGFLLIDDFWGDRQWDAFYRDFSLLFPDRQLVELQANHEIFLEKTRASVDGCRLSLTAETPLSSSFCPQLLPSDICFLPSPPVSSPNGSTIYGN